MSEYKTYALSYFHEGSTWSLTIPARSEEDAYDRIRQLYFNGRVDGELMMTIPAGPGGGAAARLICWWKNLRSPANLENASADLGGES